MLRGARLFGRRNMGKEEYQNKNPFERVAKKKLLKIIDDYFASCEGKRLLDGDGKPIYSAKGQPL